MTPHRLFLAAVAIAAIAPSASGQVRERYSLDGQHIVTETTVPVADVDLGSASGLRTLMQRIETAAAAVCDGALEPGDTRREAKLLCREAAVRTAVERMHLPALAHLAGERRTVQASAR